MTKNEIVARWMGYEIIEPDKEWALLYSTSYEWLMPAWVKFRDLKFATNVQQSIYHNDLCDHISWVITHDTITKAFDELVKGIEWYESLNKKP